MPDYRSPLPYPTRSLRMLRDFQVQAQRQLRSNLSGGHLTRRRGQSLDFSDYASYTLGDDVRHVDWPLSLRYEPQEGQTPWENWVVRRFVAEAHMRLTISLDTRETMRYPVPQTADRVGPSALISKLQVARWLAEALSIVALTSGDRVFLTTLFGTARETPPPVDLRTAMRGHSRLTPLLDDLTRSAPADETFNERIFSENHLRTAAVWIIISDYYFDATQANRLLSLIKRAQDGMRWVILVDLDSWLYDKRQLGTGGKRVTGPKNPDGYEVTITDEALQTVHRKINANKNIVFRLAEHTSWAWEPEYEDQNAFIRFFEQRFMSDRSLRKLFMRDA